MQPRPPFDRALLIPIAVSVVSILGIGWILSASNLGEVLIPSTAEPTMTPFDAGPIEREILTPPSPAFPTLEETSLAATETDPDSFPATPAETLPSASTSLAESRPTPSATRTPDKLLTAGKYDDMDPNIAYDRYWTVLKNPGTANAYKGTIHISTSMGSEASFHFTGQRFYLGYQRGRNFGIVTVMIDGQSYSFHEQAFDLVWRSPQLSPGTHSVRIIHEGGESVNLDYVEILD